MNFDFLAAEQTGLEHWCVEIGTAGWASMNAVQHKIAIAICV
jgi:hypothetical protein